MQIKKIIFIIYFEIIALNFKNCIRQKIFIYQLL